jgi:hypothetical protein
MEFFNPFSRTVALGSTLSLTNDYHDSSWGSLYGRIVHKADNPTAIRADYLENVAALMYDNAVGHHCLLQG